MKRGGGRKYGTPTVNPPQPQAIDPWSGFKIPHKDLVRQWDGQHVWFKTCDRRNEQDYVRGVKDDQTLPNPRPEVPNQFIAGPVLWESGDFMYVEGASGNLIYTQGTDPTDTL